MKKIRWSGWQRDTAMMARWGYWTIDLEDRQLWATIRVSDLEVVKAKFPILRSAKRRAWNEIKEAYLNYHEARTHQ